ncbi:MAG TPA: hypothetical protein VMG12_18335 [Polyangiaceae bacterium]|nr:hypothetical protein [Polyangiaceae bacterium]
MSGLLQRFQRRAIVVLAWLVLALSVAPAASESIRPLAVYAALASSQALPAGVLATGVRAAGDGGTATGPAVGASSMRAASTAARAAALPARRAPAPASPARVATQRPPPDVCSAALDERDLYLILCRLSC